MALFIPSREGSTHKEKMATRGAGLKARRDVRQKEGNILESCVTPCLCVFLVSSTTGTIWLQYVMNLRCPGGTLQ